MKRWMLLPRAKFLLNVLLPLTVVAALSVATPPPDPDEPPPTETPTPPPPPPTLTPTETTTPPPPPPTMTPPPPPPTITPPPPGISGGWKVTQVTCNGVDSNTVPQADLDDGTTWAVVMAMVPGMGNRTWTFNSCTQSIPMLGMFSTATQVGFFDGPISCFPANCHATCGTAGTAAHLYDYSMSMDGNTLYLTVNDFSTFVDLCAGQSAPAVVVHSRLQ